MFMRYCPSKHGRSAARRLAFSLVEVIVATAIIGVTAAALFSGMAFGFESIRLSRENHRATQILLERLELIRLVNWEKVTNGSLPTTFEASYYPSSDDGSKGVIYQGAVQIAPVDLGNPNYKDDMRQVTVSLTWQSGSRERQRSLSSQVARTGMHTYVY